MPRVTASIPRHVALLTLAGVGVTSAIPALAQVDARQAGTAPLESGPAGSRSFDEDLRLPDVEEAGADLTIPVAARAEALRGTTVLGRSRPAYDAIGFDAAGFRIFPEVALRTGYDSNVFSQVDGRGDIYGQVRGAVTARSDWSRHGAVFDGFVDERAYSKYSTESGLTYDVRAAARLDIDRQSALTTSVQHGRVFVDRGATTEILQTREPVKYDFTASDIGLRTQRGRFTIGWTGAVSRYYYDDSQSPAGLLVDQRFRDFLLYRGQGEVGYASGAGPALFVSVAAEARRFQNNSIRNRDSQGLEILGGLRGDITPLIRGRLGLGYLTFDFKDRSIKSRHGLGMDIRLDYLLTPLTTVNIRGRRELSNVSSVTLPAALSTSFAAGVDHELLRNLILSTGASYQISDYVDSPLRVKRYGGHLGGFYLANRHLRLDADASYRRRQEDRTTSQRNFGEVNATLGVTYRL